MNKIELVDGCVTAPKGFVAAGIHCGIRQNASKKDLALIYSKAPCAAASVYTLNKVQGAPIAVTKQNLADGKAHAILCNSGNANTCNADGKEKAKLMCEALGKALDISAQDVIVASTGVIGQPLRMEPILSHIEPLVAALSVKGSKDCAQAILTTDLASKEIACTFEVEGTPCTIGGIAKGSGMIHPNMATMLVFLTTDAAISAQMLQKALSADVQDTFNMISVDGDTSTNDMVSILANGQAGNAPITEEGAGFAAFKQALATITTHLCRAIAMDGEGATHLVTCSVMDAPLKELARKIAKSVITSSLLKAAIFGADANWGRILCAIGYTEGDFDVHKIDVAFASAKGEIRVCQGGAGVDFDEAKAKEILLEKEVEIHIQMNAGNQTATAWGCDLTYDYVKINGDYRS